MKYNIALLLILAFNYTIANIVKIDFPAELALIKQHDTIIFSSDFNVNDYYWEFEGSDIKTSKDKNPVVTYSNAGHFSVKLYIKNRNHSIIYQKRAVTVIKTSYKKRHYIKLTGGSHWLKQSDYNILPGDLVVLEGHATSVSFVNFHGTKDEPIRIVNKGQVKIIYYNYQSFSLVNCKHVILDGKGDANIKYGFYVKSNNANGASALTIGKLSSDIEIFGVEIAGSGFAGIMAKSDPNKTNPEAWRYNYVLSNLKIHHNYIHNTHGEGMYIGYFTYEEKNGLKAHSVKNAKIWSNIIDSTGWDGFQIGCGDYKTEIHNNIITNYGVSNVKWQNSGMSINSGFSGEIFNNSVSDGTGTGIIIKPLDIVRVYGNTIRDVGIYGIYVQNDNTTLLKCKINIFNNNITAPVSLMIDSHKDKFEQLTLLNNILIFTNSDVLLNFNDIINYPSYLYSFNYHEVAPTNWNIINKRPIKFSNNTLFNQYYFGSYNYLYTIRKKIKK